MAPTTTDSPPTDTTTDTTTPTVTLRRSSRHKQQNPSTNSSTIPSGTKSTPSKQKKKGKGEKKSQNISSKNSDDDVKDDKDEVAEAESKAEENPPASSSTVKEGVMDPATVGKKKKNATEKEKGINSDAEKIDAASDSSSSPSSDGEEFKVSISYVNHFFIILLHHIKLLTYNNHMISLNLILHLIQMENLILNLRKWVRRGK